MSDSDDTDVLLLIPPDLFLVPSTSSSDVESITHERRNARRKTGVISELVEHMQSLESRLNAIETKDNISDTFSLQNTSALYGNSSRYAQGRLTLPKNRSCVSQTSSLQNTPVKPRKSMSVPSTPSGYLSSTCTNTFQNEVKCLQNIDGLYDTNKIHTNPYTPNKHDLMRDSASLGLHVACQGSGIPHTNVALPQKDSSTSQFTNRKVTSTCNLNNKAHEICSTKSISNLSSTIAQYRIQSKDIQDMELSEVDEMIQEMEATQLELSKRINSSPAYHYHHDTANMLLSGQSRGLPKDQDNDIVTGHSLPKTLDFDYQSKGVDTFPDISLPYNDSFDFDNTDKVISEFKIWEQNIQRSISQKNENEKIEDVIVNKNCEGILEGKTKPIDLQIKVTSDEKTTYATDVTATLPSAILPSSTILPSSALRKAETTVQASCGPIRYSSSIPTKRAEMNGELMSDVCNLPQYSLLNILKDKFEPPLKSLTHASTNTEPIARKSQQLLSLSDLWDSNLKRTEEMVQIKLEEEKFRREHCEQLIQELQKRLLEQQEKVAVALRVDNEKNTLISHFHTAWGKMKQHVQMLETEHHNLQTNLKNITEKHQAELSEYQAQVKRSEGELSKTLDLAAGYKEKSDSVIKEKVDLLRAHADELENYKSLVQETQNRYEQAKGEYTKLLEKNQQTEEALKSVQQELNRERLRGGQVRSEMGVIHKALDACEAELVVLKQEKESIQLKLKEEMGRNALLEQKNITLLSLIDDAKKAEKLAKDETKSIAEEKDKVRAELQEVYQRQVDEVVSAKLQEFQTQLDVAESEFLEELKTRQQVIAEYAARKIKDIMDKHRLEINLLEEKHKEEKRLCELQLAEVLQKSSILESQLNSQRTNKSQLAEQLHYVMQKQWQQALQIISGDNVDNIKSFQKMHKESIFDSFAPKKCKSTTNCSAKTVQEPMKLPGITSEEQKFSRNRVSDNQNDSFITLGSLDDTPLTTKKESRDDLRKYIKMIAEMQQVREEPFKFRETISPPPICREVPRKHYLKKELSITSENSVTWQPSPETSTQEYSENIPISENLATKGNHSKKPPWK